MRFAGLGAIDVDVYDRYALAPGMTIAGPALIEELETSCGVGPDCTVTIDSHHNLIIDIDTPGTLRNHLMTAADIADIESLTGWDTPEAIRVDEQNVVGWSRSADFSVTELLQLRRVRH